MKRNVPIVSHVLAVAAYGLTFYSSVAWIPPRQDWKHPLSSSASSSVHRQSPTTALAFSSSSSANPAVDIPRLDAASLQQLKEQKYVIVKDFLSAELQQDLCNDVHTLRSANKFNIAKIGQDSTNALNTNIRVAETCFLGPSKLSDMRSPARDKLYSVLDTVRADLVSHLGRPMDGSLTELLYAYYPEGGFYRRHRDAIRGSASVLRTYSLLLYLNKDWVAARDKGELRLHFDSGGDELPLGQEPNYMDVEPAGGTLVLFESDKIPHEVLDTQKERVAVVGWYNRPVAVSDITELSRGVEPRVLLLAVAAALVTVGVVSLVS